MSTPSLLDPTAAALFRLGEQAQYHERYADAARFYSKTLDLAPGYEPARFNLGVSELRRGAARKAASLFEGLLEDRGETPWRPSDLPTAYNLALAHACAGRLAPALGLARDVVLAALDLDTDEDATSPLRAGIEGPASTLLAVIAIRREDRRSLRHVEDPAEPPSRENLREHLRNGDSVVSSTAELAAAFARDLHGDEARTQYLLACYDAARHEWEVALDELEDALASDPTAIRWARRDPLLRPLRAAAPGEFRNVIRWARAGGVQRSQP
jgi:tetratricopeptide (TPR) repeat protein